MRINCRHQLYRDHVRLDCLTAYAKLLDYIDCALRWKVCKRLGDDGLSELHWPSVVVGARARARDNGNDVLAVAGIGKGRKRPSDL